VAEPRFELASDGPTRILLGVDGSDTSMRATAYAIGLARRQGAVLVALFVHSTANLSANIAATAGVALQASASVADDLEQRLIAVAGELGVAVTFVRRQGNPYLELVRAAKEMRVDAIVVGASGKAGHRIVGSLAGHLVRDAKWPVTVVP
jgi:nucleotide-binding universal stress UspA family protein